MTVLDRFAAALTLVVFVLVGLPPSARAEPLTFYAATSGERALDQGEGGGNPFASALIELLARPSLHLAELSDELARLTHAKSRGFQKADVPELATIASRQLTPKPSGEKRIALVVVVSDYRKSGANSLDGARHDAERIARALTSAAFEARTVLDADLPTIRTELARFARESEAADFALIYSTGHGVEVDGVTYLLPGDYPIAQRNAALGSRALPIPELASQLKARHVNLAFWGGCRDNPLAN